MKSRLRSAPRDNLPVLLRKSEEGPIVTISSIELPQISHVDTGSFIGLFDRFSTHEERKSHLSDDVSSTFMNVSTGGARDFDWPVLAPIMSAPTRQPQKALAISTTHNVVPNRNDSTGSSSMHSTGKSSIAPTITRHSSCSSLEDNSPTPPPKDDSPEAGPTALPRVVHEEPLNTSPVAIKKPSRSSTWGSTNSARSQNLDLDKPLPIRPRRAGDVSKAVNFSRPQGTSAPHSAYLPRTSSRPHNRSTSLNGLWPPTTSSAGRDKSGKAASRSVSTTTTRQRSQSAVTIAELEGSTVHGVRPLAPRRKKIQAAPRDYQITAHTAEDVIFRIMTQITSAEDLQSAALVSKGFYNTFNRNESKLVSRLMFQSSRAAWETRRSIIVLKSSKDFRLCDYQRDLRTLQALKRSILAHAHSVCRPRTLEGLQGRAADSQRLVDEAIWRIWTFCALFGANAHKAESPAAEIDWLNGYSGARSRVMGAGFGAGNGSGLTLAQLEDMNEMWQCLQLLISAFHGRSDEALLAGVLDIWNPRDGTPEATHILEWTSYLLTLGPKVILALCSADFEMAKMLGLTRWVHPAPGQTRTTFLTAAISHVYQERLLAEATAKAAHIPLPRQASARHRSSVSVDSTFSAAAQRASGPSLRLDTTTPTIRQRPLSVVGYQSATLEIRPDCDPSGPSFPDRSSTAFLSSPTTDPSFYHTLTMNRSASTRLGPNLFPLSYNPTTPRIPFPTATLHTPPQVSAIIDPVDRALNHLVSDLGFPEQNAKRALAMTDTGSGIDVARAEELLRIEQGQARQLREPIELPTPNDIVSPLPKLKQRTSTIRGGERCDGSCPPTPMSGKRTPTPLIISGMAGTSTPLSKSASIMSRAITMTTRTRTHGHGRSRSLGNNTTAAGESTSTSDEATGPVSPITDIYGGHSDSDAGDHSDDDDDDDDDDDLLAARDDMSLEWRREEGSGDTIAPLVSGGMGSPSLRSGLGLGMSRVKSGKSASLKAWRVLGVEVAANTGVGKKKMVAATLGSLGRSSSSRGNVVGMQEYLARVERRREERGVQEGWKAQGESMGLGKAEGEQVVFGMNPDSAVGGKEGLGGFRPVVVAESEGRSSAEGKGSWRRSFLMNMNAGVGGSGSGSAVKREKTVRDKVRCFPGGERLYLE